MFYMSKDIPRRIQVCRLAWKREATPLTETEVNVLLGSVSAEELQKDLTKASTEKAGRGALV